jgi:nucleotide-binding universal stress UspA family protein
MYRTILVAIDDSHCARAALTEAIHLAASCNAHLEILHVTDYGFLQHELDQGALSTQRLQLAGAGKTLLSRASVIAKAAHVPHTTALVDDMSVLGDIAAEVRKFAGTCGAQIIVVGTHGRRGIRRLLVGSVAESLARECSVPVLLVREPIHAEGAATRPAQQATEVPHDV